MGEHLLLAVVPADEHLRSRVHTDPAYVFARGTRGTYRRVVRALHDDRGLRGPARQDPAASGGKRRRLAGDHRLQERAHVVFEALHPASAARVAHAVNGLVDLPAHALEDRRVGGSAPCSTRPADR